MLDLSNCAQVSNSVVRAILQGCPVLENMRLDRCHRITDSAFDMAESPFQFLFGCLSLQAISLQVKLPFVLLKVDLFSRCPSFLE
jgi:hypothetical protein